MASGSAELHRSTLDALDSEIAVLDAAGRIVLVNEAWCRNARDQGNPDMHSTGVGADYLAAWRNATKAAQPYANQALEGIQAVLRGTQGRCLRCACGCVLH